MLDILYTLRELLINLHKWECEEIEEKDGIRYFHGTKQEILMEKSEYYFTLSDCIKSKKDLEKLKKLYGSWVIISNNKKDRYKIEKLTVKEVNIKTIIWSEFRDQLLNVTKIKEFYNTKEKEYIANEGKDSYISPIVSNAKEKKSIDLIEFTTKFIKEDKARLVYLLADYGEGKTSFCYNFCFLHKEDSFKGIGRIPLIFFLNDCEAGTLKEFIISRLRQDYGISLNNFKTFVHLCSIGIFTVILDSFDQRDNEARQDKVQNDYRGLLKLIGKKGQVILTCRGRYYKKFLQPVKWLSDIEFQKSYLSLKGFSKEKVEEFLEKEPAIKDTILDPANELLLKGLYKKPLFLSIIKTNKEPFLELIKKRKLKGRPIKDYDIFFMVYNRWGNKDEVKLGVFKTKKLRNKVCRNIVKRSTLLGMNVSIDFDEWYENFIAVNDFSKEEFNKKGCKDDLKAFNLLDGIKLKKSNKIAFRFNSYLEFMIAFFVKQEIEDYDKINLDFIREKLLTIESRELVTSIMEYEEHAQNIKAIIEDSAYRKIDDVRYSGSNCLSILLDILRYSYLDGEEKKKWFDTLHNINFRKTILRDTDCRESDLNRLDLSYTDFTGADFSYSSLQNTRMEYSDLKDSRFNDQGELITTSFLYNSDNGPEFIVGGTENGTLIIWENIYNPPKRTNPHRQKITSLAVSSDGKFIYTGSEDGTICRTPTESYEDYGMLPFHLPGVCCLKLSNNSRYLIAGDQIGRLNVRDMEEKETYVFTGESAWISAAEISPDNDTIFAGNTQGDIFIIEKWKTNKDGKMSYGGPSANFGKEIKDIIFAEPDTLFILTESRLYSCDKNNIEEVSEYVNAEAVSFSKKSGLLFWTEQKKILCKDIKESKELKKGITIIFSDQEGTTIASSSDGSIVSVGGDFLVVFQQNENRLYEKSVKQDMYMNCRGLIFNGCQGLDTQKLCFFMQRGAILPPDTYLRDFIDIDQVKIYRLENEFKCYRCSQKFGWNHLFKIEKKRLICKVCKD